MEVESYSVFALFFNQIGSQFQCDYIIFISILYIMIDFQQCLDIIFDLIREVRRVNDNRIQLDFFYF